METLQDIEYRYISDIVKLFCKSYVELYGPNKPNAIKDLIMKQIENKLLKTDLINNYGVSTNILSTIERRDLILDNLVNDSDNDIEEHVDVYIEHRRGIFYSYRYNLKDGSFIVTP